MAEITKLPNSAIITLDISLVTNPDYLYSVSCLDQNGQVISNVIINIIESIPPPPPILKKIITIFLPTISSVNNRNVSVKVNRSNLIYPVVIAGAVNSDGDTIDAINGESAIPCVNGSGYQVAQVIGGNEWQSLAEVTAYSKVVDGGTLTELPRRDTIEFAGANVSVVDDAITERTIVTINP